ncbi:MAG: hypothetical protein ABI838_05715 [Chloroflexota bacterium]
MRRPLAWLILLEIAVVAALAAATYHVVATRWHRPPPIAAAPAPAAPGSSRPATPRALPKAAIPTPTPRGPAPGLSVDPGFWNDQLARVNRDQALLADIQSRAARAVTDWVRAYVDGVLLPAVREAEKK